MKVHSCDILKLEGLIYLFLYIFSLQLPLFKNSSLILFFWLPFRLFFNKRMCQNLKCLLSSYYVYYIIAIYVFIFVYAIVVTFITGRFDFSLLPSIVNVLIHFIIAVFVVAFVGYCNVNKKDLLYYLVVLFAIQSIIQLMAFFYVDILDFIRLFQPSRASQISENFGGRKGLALSGNMFFSLAAQYGLIFILYTEYLEMKGKVGLGDIVLFVLLFVGGIFSGRTFFLGVIIFFCVIIIFSSFHWKVKLKMMQYPIFCILGVCVLWRYLPGDMQLRLYDLYLYSFEFLENFLNGEKIHTTSTDSLFNNMYYRLPISTFLFGDGLYTNSDGSYYGHTDAGYMRNILYGGIFFFCICLFVDLFLIFKSKIGNSRLLWCILVYLLILHIKGEVLGYLLSIHCILFVFFIFCLFESKYKLKK